jgi:hypothetical protein
MDRHWQLNHAHDGNDAARVAYPSLTLAPPNYGLVTTITAGVAAAGSVVIGAGCGAVVDGAWISVPEDVTISEVTDANTKYPYLAADGPYISTTAPTYDAALGYWTDELGGRWLGCVLTKSAAATFRALSATGIGANAAYARIGQYVRSSAAFVAGTAYEVTGLATYALAGASESAMIMQYRAWNANGAGRSRCGLSSGSDNLNAWGGTVVSGNVAWQTIRLELQGAASYFTQTDIAATSASYDYLIGIAHQF